MHFNDVRPNGEHWHDYYCNNSAYETGTERNGFFLDEFLSDSQKLQAEGVLGTLNNNSPLITDYRKITHKLLTLCPNLAFSVPGWNWPDPKKPLLVMGKLNMAGRMLKPRCHLHYLENSFYLMVTRDVTNINGEVINIIVPHNIAGLPNNPLLPDDIINPGDEGLCLGEIRPDGNTLRIGNLTDLQITTILGNLSAFNANSVQIYINNHHAIPNPITPRTLDQGEVIDGGEGIVGQENPEVIYMNTILFGPPGTGKTYTLTERALRMIDGNEAVNESPSTRFTDHIRSGRIEFTTFHQNYAYEDFIEGLRAEYDAAHQAVVYRIEAGILKRIAYRALYAWLTGETPEFELSEDQIGLVKNYLLHGTVPDGFAERQQIPNYVLIIDEINRGNVARIFGELITLVEDSKRARNPGEAGDGHQPLLATLPYTKEPFILPPNLYLIGTMNTADRSLIGLDAALRRRFVFEEMPPQPGSLNNINVEGINLGAFLTQLNQLIRERDTRDHCIGHAYFMGVSSLDQLAGVMRNKVIPQLQEYFHDRPEELHDLLWVGDVSFVDEQGQINDNAVCTAANYHRFSAV